MPEPERPQSKAGLIPIPQGCLTTLLILPIRLLSIPAVWFATRFRAYARRSLGDDARF